MKTHSVAFINLVGKDGTCIQDGAHELTVYKCDGKKPDEDFYKKMPSLKEDIPAGKKSISSGNFTCTRTESFKIR